MLHWTTKPVLALAALLTVATVTGCASRETRRGHFREDRDQCIGERLGDPSSWWCGWNEAMSVTRIDDDLDEYEVRPAAMGECRWIYVVERKTQKVTGWRYASAPADCFVRIDWLGAW